MIREYKVAYFTASCDSVQKNTDFAKELELDYPILSDPDGKVAKAFGVYNADRGFSNRWTYIIGDDGKIKHVDKSVKAAKHAEDVLAKLKELGVPKN